MSSTGDVNQVIATVLNELYEAFPVRIYLREKNLYSYSPPASSELTEIVSSFPWERPKDTYPKDLIEEAKKYNETIRWLEHEGFVRVESEKSYEGKQSMEYHSECIIFEAVLTPKGYKVLNSTTDLRYGSEYLSIALILTLSTTLKKENVTIGQLLGLALQKGPMEYIRVLVNEIVSTAIAK